MSATSVTQPDDRSVVITRLFDAPRELVWRAWTEPEHMAQWFGPKVFHNPVCEVDLRVGGAWRIVMRAPDGTDYPLKGVYREIVKPERIVSSIDLAEHPGSWHAMVNPGREPLELSWTVTFEDFAGKTRLSVRTDFSTTTLRDAFVKMGMGEGWSESFDKLADLVARAPA